jgi:4-azaleucine resistance transporter AzlC
LFVIIFIDQWEKSKNHLPAILGLAVAVICLLIFGQRNFMLVSLIAVSGILLFLRENKEEEK